MPLKHLDAVEDDKNFICTKPNNLRLKDCGSEAVRIVTGVDACEIPL